MNPAFDSSRPLAPLAQRRRAVLIGVFGFLLLLLAQFLRSAESSSALWNGLSAAGMVIVVFGWSRLLFPGFMGLPRLDQPDLDERQRAVLTRAYATAYQVLALGLLLVYAYGWLTDVLPGLPRLTGGVNAIMLVGLVWIVMGLPAAILAWTEPDPAGE
ncbi:hypothetical protein Dcar01_02231 [Deinococcus carri]|uniref:Uncharacterized protein n=1 Tax=Deinococcus carri TaxID=1211323 RepID=A0ABP9W817_9DEIO